MYGIVITGLPASGKTYYTEKLLSGLSKKKKRLYHIYGDAIAHIAYGCSYTEDQLDLKYDNITNLILNARKHGYSIVIIDDFYKRKNDFLRVLQLFDESYVILLRASYKDLFLRNQSRPKYHRLDDGKLEKYITQFGNIIEDKDIDLLVDVSSLSRRQCVTLITDYIEHHCFLYDYEAK